MKGSEKRVRTATPVHNRLEVLRAEHGMSRQQLADRLGANYQTIGYLERGEWNPSLELALRVAELFAVPVEFIFSLKPFRPMSQEISELKSRS
jgi:DNA-binding XRE family transcriptional regulator